MARRKQFSHPIILNNTNTFTHLHHLRQWPYTICGVVGWSLLHRNMCYFYLLVVLRTNLEINIWKRHFVFTPLQITRILFFSHISKEKQSNVTPKSFFLFHYLNKSKSRATLKKRQKQPRSGVCSSNWGQRICSAFRVELCPENHPPPPPGLQRCLATKTRHGWCPISFNRSTATRALEGPATWQSHMRHIESGACCCSNSKGQQHFVCWAAERSHIGESDVNRKWWLSESNSEGCYLIKCTFFRNMLTFDCMILVFFKLSKDILCIIKF